jgi:hypothetical protein
MFMFEYDLRSSLRLNVFAPLLRILHLHNDHVTVIAAFLEQPTGDRAFLDW